jgi:hypothetical protein
MDNWAELPEEPPLEEEAPAFGSMAAGGLAAAGLAAAGMAMAQSNAEDAEPVDSEAEWGTAMDMGEPVDDLGEPVDFGDMLEDEESFPLGAEADFGIGEAWEPEADLGGEEPAATEEPWPGADSPETLEPMEEEFAPIDWSEEDLSALDNDAGTAAFAASDTNGFHHGEAPVAGANIVDEVDDADATDDFIHKFAPVSPEEVEQRTPGRAKSSGSNLKLILGIGAGALALLLAVFGITALLGRMRQPDAPVTPPPTEIPAPPDGGTTPPTEPTTPPTEPPVTPPVSANPFRDAVNAATQASQLAQTATTKEDWQAVADAWEQAITLMQQVPESDPNYATAQDRAVAYQPNLTYAQQNVQRFP